MKGKTELILFELQILLLQAGQELAQILILRRLRIRLFLEHRNLVLEILYMPFFAFTESALSRSVLFFALLQS